MVRADQDVAHADRDKRAHHRQYALRRTRVIHLCTPAGTEDQLLAQVVALVDVHERLVRRVVREHSREDAHRPRARDGNPEPQQHAVPVDRRFHPQPLDGQGRGNVDHQARRDERDDAIACPRRFCGI